MQVHPVAWKIVAVLNLLVQIGDGRAYSSFAFGLLFFERGSLPTAVRARCQVAPNPCASASNPFGQRGIMSINWDPFFATEGQECAQHEHQ